jgi:thioredoxin-related protein
MRSLRLAILFVLFQQLAFAQPPATDVPTADQVMKAAFEQAGRQKKNVLLMFHASWCGWCHRMDTSLNDPAVKKFFDDNYVITHLVVDESPANKNLENAGANEVRTKYHGDGSGIPFWLVFDKDGKLLADSKLRANNEGPEGGNNIGCPANPEEVTYFVEILKKTSKITDPQLTIIAERFRKNAN